jgi:hypothetical protein
MPNDAEDVSAENETKMTFRKFSQQLKFCSPIKIQKPGT